MKMTKLKMLFLKFARTQNVEAVPVPSISAKTPKLPETSSAKALFMDGRVEGDIPVKNWLSA